MMTTFFLDVPQANYAYEIQHHTFMYLQYARSNVWLWFAFDHALQERPYGAGVSVHLVQVSCATHERTQFTSQSLKIMMNNNSD